MQTNERLSARRVGLQRLFGRLRHGLLTQEILDRLARAGLVIYPYFVAWEPVREEPDPIPQEHCTFRVLGADDAAEMARFAPGRPNEQAIVRLLAKAACLGAFCDGQLAGYSWARLDVVPVPFAGGHAVFRLQPREAYLFDMYVAPPYRGLRLAGSLRQAMQRELVRRGSSCFYSVTLAFNRSSRRFKSRLGVREIELRLYVRLRLGSLPGCDLRLWRREPHLRSPRFLRVPAVAEARSGA